MFQKITDIYAAFFLSFITKAVIFGNRTET